MKLDYYLLILDCYSDGEDQLADEEPIGDKCVCCGKPAHKLVYWGRQY